MAVIRPSFPEDHFTRVPNAWLRDPNLPPAPKAYLAYLLSHAAGYRCSTSQAARDMGVNRSTVTAWNAKLVERGYFLAVDQGRSNGRYEENDYTITPCTISAPPLPENRAPAPREPARSTVTEKPRTVEPSRKTQHIEEQGEKNRGRRTPEPLPLDVPPREAPRSAEESFDEFWQAYPKKVSKDTARLAWRRAVHRADPDKIIDVVRRYPFRDERRFVKDPATWLNGGCWEDDLDAVRAARDNGHRSRSEPYRNPPPGSYTVGDGKL